MRQISVLEMLERNSDVVRAGNIFDEKMHLDSSWDKFAALGLTEESKNKQKEIDQYFQSHCLNNEAMPQREEFPNQDSAKCDNCQYAKYCLTHLENPSVTGCTTGFPGGMAIENITEQEQKAVEQLERVSSMLGAIGETEDYTEVAIHALEENRIYHALGTPEELRKKLEELEAEVKEYHKRR